MRKDLLVTVLAAIQVCLATLMVTATQAGVDKISGSHSLWGSLGGLTLPFSLAVGVGSSALLYLLLPPERTVSGQSLLATGASLALVATAIGGLMTFGSVFGGLMTSQSRVLARQTERLAGQIETDQAEGLMLPSEPNRLIFKVKEGFVIYAADDGSVYRCRAFEPVVDPKDRPTGSLHVLYGDATFHTTANGILVEVKTEDDEGNKLRVIKLVPQRK